VLRDGRLFLVVGSPGGSYILADGGWLQGGSDGRVVGKAEGY
jgi:gamma-glutamyltranspeptidase